MSDVGETIGIQEVVWTPICELTIESRAVNVRFSVIRTGQTRHINSRATGKMHLINESVVGDESAIINLTLWNHDIDEIEPGKTYELLNGHINIYDESMSLIKGRWGIIREGKPSIVQVDGSLDMSRPFMGRPNRRKRKRSQTGRSFQGTPGREIKGYCSRKGF